MTPTYLTGGQIFSRLCAYRLTPFDLIKFGMVTDQCSVQVLRHRKTTFRELIQFYCQKSAVSSQHRSVNINAVENGTLVDSRCGDEEVEEPKKLRRADCDSPIDLRRRPLSDFSDLQQDGTAGPLLHQLTQLV